MVCLCGGNEDLCEWPGRRALHGFYPGQIVVTEGYHKDIISNLVAWVTGSWFTHCFMVTGEDEIVEAYVPCVRRRSLTQRLKELRQEDRAYYVLDLPRISLSSRCKLVKVAHSYVGKFYDLGAVVCSRSLAGIVMEALNINIFEGKAVTQADCTPADLLHSRLEVVKFKPSSRMRFALSLIER